MKAHKLSRRKVRRLVEKLGEQWDWVARELDKFNSFNEVGKCLDRALHYMDEAREALQDALETAENSTRRVSRTDT